MPDRAVDGQRPTHRFRDAIFAGPVRGLEQWGALTADDWATAGVMMDENPHWNPQHVIEHFIGSPTSPPTVEPAAVVEYPPLPVPLRRKEPVPLRKEPREEPRKRTTGERVARVLPPVPTELPVLLPVPPVLTFLPPILESTFLTPVVPEPPVVVPEPPAELPVFFLPVPPDLTFLPPEIVELPVSLPVPPVLAFRPPVVAAKPPTYRYARKRRILPTPRVFLPIPPSLIFLPPIIKWDLAAELQQEDQAREYSPELSAEPEPAVEPELAVEPRPVAEPEPPVEAPLVPGPLPETYILPPLPLWEARHNVSLDAWTSKVTAMVKAYGPFPDRVVIIVSIRFSGGRDSTKEQYDQHVERCVEAASTLIRYIRSLPGQENRQVLVYPWIRCNISSTQDWFGTVFQLGSYRHGIPRTTSRSCRLKELEFVLDSVQPDTEVWWLSIGIDALTTDLENLRRVQTRWPALQFTVAVMVHSSFCPDVRQFGHQDICPRRPAVSGMRIRIYSFARLLSGVDDLRDPNVRKLLAVWQYMNDAKLNGVHYDRNLVRSRNTMPVSPGGIDSWGMRGDRM